ncbi:unnamed protein product [Paramecium pentaurelia]|uniref:Uncharacterized protein n=1 Tax=Paramecium pentaurelia TaxID=43138 RepID=A0A8S1SFX0_9CILI|nr:unnamed protein product [Paramecium pentaurelia]
MNLNKDLFSLSTINIQYFLIKIIITRYLYLSIDGKLTLLKKWMNHFNNFKEIINSKDPEVKTPLFYSCYFNFKNILMYLLIKGADPFLISKSDLMYIISVHKEEILNQCKSINLKKTDSQKGQLINADKHFKQVQLRFSQFQAILSELYQQFLDQNLQYFRSINVTIDYFQRNPIHYGSLSKYTKCFQYIKSLAKFDFKFQGWDLFNNIIMEVQLLIQTGYKNINPRQYKHYHECNFLNQQLLEQKLQILFIILRNYKRKLLINRITMVNDKLNIIQRHICIKHHFLKTLQLLNLCYYWEQILKQKKRKNQDTFRIQIK